MNMFELSLFKEYVYYPTNRLHLISINIKFFIVALYIALLPATSKYVVMTQTVVVLSISLKNYKVSRISSNTLTKLFYCLNILLAILFIHQQSIPSSVIVLRYQLKIFALSATNSRFFTITNIVYVNINQTIIRAYFILLNYFTLQKLILRTTKTEEILVFNIGTVSPIIKRSSLLNEIRFSLLLSYQFAYSFEDEIKSLVISYYLSDYSKHRLSTLNNTLKLIFKLIYLGTRQSVNKVCCKAQTLYIREIEVDQSQYWLI